MANLLYKSLKQYSQDINELVLEDLIQKGKALPVGTLRTWGGIDYIKHADGWVTVSNGKVNSGKNPKEVSDHANAKEHEEYAKKHRESIQPKTSSSKPDVTEKLQTLKDQYKEEGKKHATKVVDQKLKELKEGESKSEAPPTAKESKLKNSINDWHDAYDRDKVEPETLKEWAKEYLTEAKALPESPFKKKLIDSFSSMISEAQSRIYDQEDND
jgi:hypothetical protein